MDSNVITFMEWIAAAAGLVSVYLLTKQSVLAWPAGLLSVFIYVFIFYQNKLYSDFMLHIIYVMLNTFGWWRWSTGKGGINPPLKVSLLSSRIRWFIMLGISIATYIWGDIMHKNTSAVYVFPDAFILVASLVAQYLLALKKIENWILWILVDIIAIIIYYLKGLYVTSGLYLLYLILCISGWLQWSKERRPSSPSNTQIV
ncbi:MAG: nicotinamide mononucleotide transporter [Saprospiraceae bacterium]|nr:nicotinamide mononucleotide transporter [Saprospiraceae bacterium]MBK7437658.1 nicotinamide mononucleotide transporter [Saprospiraceae bacterium]MBK8512290.1 nicotinamide mononucleotide transporter [Saprospiraceae bacterium]MBP7921406.1 nicotinamide mononucleotide transporter [Saprospiraceae bacterium]MBP8095094.1 nicotinamide mononucleotide transporter [Saprospiraceae bacterium]